MAFATGETSVTLHGYAAAAPTASASDGRGGRRHVGRGDENVHRAGDGRGRHGVHHAALALDEGKRRAGGQRGGEVTQRPVGALDDAHRGSFARTAATSAAIAPT